MISEDRLLKLGAIKCWSGLKFLDYHLFPYPSHWNVVIMKNGERIVDLTTLVTERDFKDFVIGLYGRDVQKEIWSKLKENKKSGEK